MKESSEWVRQEMVDQAADEVRTERQCEINAVKPYWVAKKLGCESNGALCTKVYDWRRRRSETHSRTIEVPPHGQEEFQQILDRQNAEMMNCFKRVVGSIGSDLDRAAALRIADAESRAKQAEADRDELLNNWRTTEDALATAERKLTALQQAFNETRLREQRLIGRLEQSVATRAPESSPPKIVPTGGPPSSGASGELPPPGAGEA